MHILNKKFLRKIKCIEKINKFFEINNKCKIMNVNKIQLKILN